MPVSILKPVKGIDPGLAENLESFFQLRYPSFELLFSIADEKDLSRPIIENLINKYPHVRAKLFVGETPVGPNPKINNLIKSYTQAKHDWILISDSNTRVKPDHLMHVTQGFSCDVGVITAIVAGREPSGIGAEMEAVFLNSFYARWMTLAPEFNSPVVIGKSMLFRRSDVCRFGGLQSLGQYLAEDQMMGQAMLQLGKKIKLMQVPITQPIGRVSLASFWARHLRWGRIRKSQAPIAYVFEPLLCSSVLSGLIGAWAVSQVTGWSYSILAALHFGIWFIADVLVVMEMGEKIRINTILAWGARELSHPFLWLHIGMSNQVIWRGQRLRLQPGGTLERQENLLDATDVLTETSFRTLAVGIERGVDEF